MLNKNPTKPDDEYNLFLVGEYSQYMENLLGKEKWQSLTCWQQMCEIAAVQESRERNKNFWGSLFGL